MGLGLNFHWDPSCSRSTSWSDGPLYSHRLLLLFSEFGRGQSAAVPSTQLESDVFHQPPMLLLLLHDE